MIEIDAKGLICPQPLMLAKQAFDKAAIGESIRIATDSETSMQNLMKFLGDLNASPVCESVEGYFLITAIKKTVQTKPDEICCSGNNAGSLVIAVTSETMGSGPDDLGKILMKAFINTIIEIETLPTHVVFYNSGVLLVHKDSDVLDSLKKLENKGVYILVCGTCANYFQLNGAMGAGQLSNMYTIVDVLSKAHSIIRP